LHRFSDARDTWVTFVVINSGTLNTGVVVSNPAQGLQVCMRSSVFVLRCIGRSLVQAVLPNACNVLDPGKRKALGCFGM
jgi:hypothetical protein